VCLHSRLKQHACHTKQRSGIKWSQEGCPEALIPTRAVLPFTMLHCMSYATSCPHHNSKDHPGTMFDTTLHVIWCLFEPAALGPLKLSFGSNELI